MVLCLPFFIYNYLVCICINSSLNVGLCDVNLCLESFLTKRPLIVFFILKSNKIIIKKKQLEKANAFAEFFSNPPFYQFIWIEMLLITLLVLNCFLW